MAYTLLDSSRNLIRLLHLAPASSEDETIRCSFTVACLDDSPDFEALSYVWGDVNDTNFVDVEGRVVQITANLHTALKHMRLEDQVRILWVDALCINQSDLKERMHQVSQMGSIYGQASQVIVWLGEGWDGSDLAMEFMRKMGDENLHFDPSLEPSIRVNGLGLDSSELRFHITCFFDLPWWKRTWTIQEYVLAQRLVFQCSRSLISREKLKTAERNMSNHYYSCCRQANLLHIKALEKGLHVGESFRRLYELEYIIKRRGDSYSALLAMSVFSYKEVTDPRDKVYGLLGLGTGQYADLVAPDYSLSPEEVCVAVALKSVERTKTLEFLSHLFDSKNSALPSFIPDWTGSLEWLEEYRYRLASMPWFNASKDVEADFKIISHGMATTSGVIFDVITATHANPKMLDMSLDGKAPVSETLRELHQIGNIEEMVEELYCHTNDSRLVAFWDTLRGGLDIYFEESDLHFHRERSRSDFSKYFEWEKVFRTGPDDGREFRDSKPRYLYPVIKSTTIRRRFFSTKKGYFGFGPEKCEVGDVVVVLAGGQVPYIIRAARQLQQNKTCYAMLGDSYVCGIMDGEVFEILDENERVWKEILLV